MEEKYAGYSKLGPREQGRKSKGKKKPQAIRQAKQRRTSLLQKLERTPGGCG